MAENTTPKTNQDYINEMYDKSLSSQTAQMETDYNKGVSDLEGQQKKAQQQADTALTRTYVEAAKKAKNYAETQKASGLTSGTMAQAKLAQDNQTQADMTAIRTAQQTIDAEIQREKDLLAQEYAAAIAKAKADNDLARAQALYEQAQADEDALLQKQKEAAALMASAGDYSLYKALYGLTDEQIAKLQGETTGGKGGSGSGGGSSGSNAGGTIVSGTPVTPAPAQPSHTPKPGSQNAMFKEQKMFN